MSKEILEKFRLEPNNKEILEKIKLEFRSKVESKNLIQSFLPKQEKEPNLPLDSNLNKQKHKENESRNNKSEATSHPKHIENNHRKQTFESSKNQKAKNQKDYKLVKYLIGKKQRGDEEAQILRGEIRKLEVKLKKVINKDNKKNTIISLRESILSKKGKLDKLISANPVKVIRSNNILSFPNQTNEIFDKIGSESNRVYKKCPYCSASILNKNFSRHIKTKCPKQPEISDSKVNKKDILNGTEIFLEYVSWTLLPKGEWLFKQLSNHFKHLNSNKKWKNKSFDETRFQKIEKTLYPNKCFIGKGEFEGYIAYCFSWTSNVVLECPIYGNAIYVIRRGKYSWQDIAKASKWEARTEYSNQITVINHSETWLERLEQNLRYGL